MLRQLLLTPIALSTLGCATQQQSVRTVSIEDVEQLIEDSNDSLYILSFWATWCVPCREELPYFERVTEEFSSRKVKVFLVSVDEQKHLKSQLVPFVRNEKLHSQVLWLSAGNPNDWIPRISEEWGGNIPATLFVHTQKGIVELHDREISYEELLEYIKRINDDE